LDVAFVVRQSDVSPEKFASSYAQLTTDFTELQCQTLIRWAHSRKPEQIIFEDGFEEAVTKAQLDMMSKYHSSTQLVNQEMRAKLTRLSASLAAILYSTPNDDWDKILVTKEHLDYIVEFLNYLYCHPNMKMDQYSEMMRKSEVLGNMDFMENICKYIDTNQLIQGDEFTEKHIQQIFYDYLQRVEEKEVYIPDAKSDKIKSFGQKIYISTPKLIGLLISRNCFIRTNKGTYRKTQQYNDWLVKRLELGDDVKSSDILELGENKQVTNLIEAAKKFKHAS
jgi:hypothetical protein